MIVNDNILPVPLTDIIDSQPLTRRPIAPVAIRRTFGVGPARTHEVDPIYSRNHFVLSVLVGIAAVLYLGPSAVRGVALVAYAAAVGVGIDFDHFLLARLNAGDWRALRYCLHHPSVVFLDQSSIFESGEVGSLHRLLSHALIGGALVAGLAFVRPALAVLTAVVLYVHVVADLVADVREFEEPVSPSG